MKAATNAKPTPVAARAAFVEWLAKKHPSFYAQVRQDTGLGDVAPTPNLFTQILNSATGLLSQYVASKEQLAQLKVNIARAKAGQPPLTSDQFATGTVPQRSMLGGIPTWVLLAGGAGILYLLLSKD